MGRHFQSFKKNHIPHLTIKKVIEFAFCLPGTNAATERVFSLVNNIWTSKKTQMTVDTIKAILEIRCNLGDSCQEFYDNIKGHDSLLKKIHSAEKYV